MTPSMQTFQLTPDELEIAKPLLDACDPRITQAFADGFAKGFRDGVESTKIVFVQQLLARRKPNEPSQPGLPPPAQNANGGANATTAQPASDSAGADGHAATPNGVAGPLR